MAAAADNSTGIEWGPLGTTTGATSITNGATNTAAIVTAVGPGNYAARKCSTYSASGGIPQVGFYLPEKT